MDGSGRDAGVLDAAERLRQIEALTDAALAHLNVEDLLDELLDRLRDILQVDTAAVLLLDADGSALIATAARGIEEEVRQGVRIPVRKGFAGRIAAEARPVILDRVDETTVANPLLIAKGIRAMAGVPLIDSGELVGVLHVGSISDREFGAEEVELLQMVADRVTGATRARLAATERDAALALQRSLMPSRLPEIAGLDLAARYIPGGGRGSVATGTTSSRSAAGGSVWSSATCPATVSRPRSSWVVCAAPCGPTPSRAPTRRRSSVASTPSSCTSSRGRWPRCSSR